MHQLTLSVFFLLAITSPFYAQKVSGKLQLYPGKRLTISMEIKNTMTQQAGAQAIDFSVNGGIIHHYTVIDTANENATTLRHEPDRLQFVFEGMGKKKSFDSDNKKDPADPFGKQFEELMTKKYDMVIDSSGRIIKTIPESMLPAKQEDGSIIIAGMLRELTNAVYPPKKEAPGLLSVLPPYETGIGESWTDSTSTDMEKSTTVNTLSAITDSTIVVDYKTTSTSTDKSEMMGMPATTHLKNTTTGKIILDKTTGIIREKISVTDSNGTTETRGSALPISGKIITRIVVQ